MRHVVCVVALLLAAPAAGQTDSQKPSEWIGTLEFTDRSGLSLGRVTATIDGPPANFTGRWTSSNGSGPFEGTTDDKGRIRVKLTMYSAALDAQRRVTDPEGCVGTGEFSGAMYGDFVMRWTARAISGGDCAPITNVVMTLQPRP